MIIEDSLAQMRQILQAMKEMNDERDGVPWQAAVYYHTFLLEEVDRIERNLKIKENLGRILKGKE